MRSNKYSVINSAVLAKQMTTAHQFQRSISRFGDYSRDLLRSDFHGFESALALFLDFFEKDPVFSSVHAQLLAVPNANFDAWMKENEDRYHGLVFPLDMEVRIALMYELLRRIASKKIPLLNFALQHFRKGPAKVDPVIRAFNDAVTNPLVREVLYRIEDAAEKLPRDTQAQIPATAIQIINSATNVIQQSAVGNNITQVASNQNNTELAKLFERLEEAVRAQGLDSDELQEQLEIVASARDNATSEKPKRSVVKVLLGALPVAGDILSIASSILSLMPPT